ncbi:MAG TPA: cupin domain-containing protein [Blastocatellia bacterium]|nr:cupin domain-containing protein [Blastocatellia bacterium]
MPVTHYRWEDIPKEPVNQWLHRRMIWGERLMITQVFLKRGCHVPQHQHVHEQITYILEGALKFFVEGQEIIVRAGEVLHIPSNVPHEAVALEDTLDLDVFSPPREDWLAGTDDYLRTVSQPYEAFPNECEATKET